MVKGISMKFLLLILFSVFISIACDSCVSIDGSLEIPQFIKEIQDLLEDPKFYIEFSIKAK